MTNKTNAEFTALSGSVATDDELLIWDASAGATRKITQANLITTAALKASTNTFTALQTFSAGIAFANETLSVYDTGTWSPDLQFGGGKTGLTYGSVAGRYVKIGALVMVFCQFALANKGSSTGNAIIEDSSGNLAGLGTPLVTSEAAVRWASMTSSLVNMRAENIGTSLYVLGLTAAGTGQSQLTHADFANNSTIRFAISWIV